ncbi:hypothetical protein [Bowmanella dokdonensis]|uniref:DUF1439 domain-containing protein n=1 Tax=Bowmanella dokdonensis TaxID=751969 RepID=A0A939IS35_9ALTE|nr:hypothetical protein [Bowmanella dokdonensis]MBN7826754.1 hypothetical protein [Bowmanella dokdonensis]
MPHPLSWISRLQYFFMTCLVKWKRLRHFSLDEQELNELLTPGLPLELLLEVPAGKGLLKILKAKLALRSNDIQLELYCDLKLDVMANRLYQAHLRVLVGARPEFNRSSRSLRPTDIQIDTIQLIQDDYLLLKDGRNLLSRILPGSVGNLLNSTLGNALDLLSQGGIYADLRDYLQLYLSGSKQRVLDYHKNQIENQLAQTLSQGKLEYRLDETSLDERLFAELGQKVEVKEGRLLFIFHP